MGRWLAAGATREYAYTEMVHNTFAMVHGWTTLFLNYLDLEIDGRVPEALPAGEDAVVTTLYLQELVHMIMPASAITSTTDGTEDTLVIHNLNLHKRPRFNPAFREAVARVPAACPYAACVDPSNASVPQGVALASHDDANVAFGIGCRRCPGEQITLVYLEEVVARVQAPAWRMARLHRRYHVCGLGQLSWIRLDATC